jgi:predicted dehydrogenase
MDVHRKFYFHDHPGREGLPTSYSEALWDRPEVDLVAGAERDVKRLALFGERYGIKALYTDALEMYRKENLDIVAVATNTKGRAFLTVKAAEMGAKAIFTDKPMAFTLEEADSMVKSCADRGIPLSCGAITTTHPSFAKAKELVTSGAIGDVTSIEARGPGAQHQNWSYFLESPPAWVSGTGDEPRRNTGSDEFAGQGIAVTESGLVVHFRKGAPGVRISGTEGEISFGYAPAWRLWQQVDTLSGRKRQVEMPWPDPQFVPPYGAVYCLDDLMRCLAGELDEPKNSGRRVATALEVEIALKLSSAQGGARIELPLEDRSLGLQYAWFR